MYSGKHSVDDTVVIVARSGETCGRVMGGWHYQRKHGHQEREDGGTGQWDSQLCHFQFASWNEGCMQTTYTSIDARDKINRMRRT